VKLIVIFHVKEVGTGRDRRGGPGIWASHTRQTLCTEQHPPRPPGYHLRHSCLGPPTSCEMHQNPLPNVHLFWKRHQVDFYFFASFREFCYELFFCYDVRAFICH
jgi:hypothetical protein